MSNDGPLFDKIIQNTGIPVPVNGFPATGHWLEPGGQIAYCIDGQRVTHHEYQEYQDLTCERIGRTVA